MKINLNKDNVEYTQRSISNVFLNGHHSNEDATLTTDWKIAPTISRIHDKDIRTTTFQDEGGIYSFRKKKKPKEIGGS